MYLNKIYSEPENLFRTTKFGRGIRFIYAKKDGDGDSKKSLNGVGKSLIINLIDYCLLSSNTPHITSVINNNDVKEFKVVLEFSVEGKDYLIKRPLLNGNKNIDFGEKGTELKQFKNTNTDKELSKILCELIFKKESYLGGFDRSWLRQLMPFFIKKQSSSKKDVFSDPITYISNTSEMNTIPYHLFLLGIKNTLFLENIEITKTIKELAPVISQVEQLVSKNYGISDIKEAEKELQKLNQQLTRLEDNIKNFELAEQYKSVEDEANEMTREIKVLLLQNISDNEKIHLYEESSQFTDNVNTRSIINIYKQFNEEISSNLKKTLDDAIKFRKTLSYSREKFLESEIKVLKRTIEINERKIYQYEKKRASMLGILESKEAIQDLAEAYQNLSIKRDDMSDLKSNTKTLKDLNSKLASYNTQASKLYEQILEESDQINDDLEDFREILLSLHDNIYTEFQGDAALVFSPNKKKDSKVNYELSIPKELSKGKNQGRTLLYDLSMLIYNVKHGFNAPKFLIHDGIFDGMDKAHFVHLYRYLDSLHKQGFDFQYIVTLNQEGTVKDTNFGKGAEDISTHKIEENSDLILTPSSPLFGKNWS